MNFNTFMLGGQRAEIVELGNQLRVLKGTVPFDVRFFRQGVVIQESKGVSAGFSETFDQPFDKVEIYTLSTQEIQIFTRHKSRTEVVTPAEPRLNTQRDYFFHTAPLVMNFSGVLIVENLSRKYLVIQNNHATGNIWIRMDGEPASAADIKIKPGDKLVFDLHVPKGEISAVGDLATNNAVSVLEAQ